MAALPQLAIKAPEPLRTPSGSAVFRREIAIRAWLAIVFTSGVTSPGVAQPGFPRSIRILDWARIFSLDRKVGSGDSQQRNFTLEKTSATI
jgi:hypothetical protein